MASRIKLKITAPHDLTKILLSLGLLLLSPLILISVSAQQCDYFNDVCPYPAEGVCDPDDGICPPNSDCLDCDPCRAFDLGDGCDACTRNGCVWCGADAICTSQPLGSSYWDTLSIYSFAEKSSCLEEEDWVSTCDDTSGEVFSDPLYSAQKWAYQLLNVEPVWEQGIFGQGVMLRVNDPDGVDPTHPELADRFNESASCANSYTTYDLERSHGTGVASLAVGSGNNDHCAVGIAPEASLSACIGPTAISDKNVAAFLLDGLDTTDISINSWGFDACYRLPATYIDDDDYDYDDDTSGRSGFLGFGNNDDEIRGRRKLQDTCPFVRDADDNPCELCTASDPEACEGLIVEYCQAYYAEEFIGW